MILQEMLQLRTSTQDPKLDLSQIKQALSYVDQTLTQKVQAVFKKNIPINSSVTGMSRMVS